MMKIRIERLSQLSQPMMTPAGLTEKRFRAIVKDYERSGLNLELEIEIRDQKQKNGNRIIVENLSISSSRKDSLGITSELLRKVAIQKLAEICVLESIDQLFPQSRQKRSLKVPTQEDLSRMELVAQTSLRLGIKPPVKLIQIALLEQGVTMAEGTIRNYLTKATKAGLLKIKSINVGEVPDQLRELNPDSMSAEAELIDKLLSDAIASDQLPISPIEYRRHIEATRIAEKVKKEKKESFLREKHRKDLEKRNAPLKQKRKAGK